MGLKNVLAHSRCFINIYWLALFGIILKDDKRVETTEFSIKAKEIVKGNTTKAKRAWKPQVDVETLY